MLGLHSKSVQPVELAPAEMAREIIEGQQDRIRGFNSDARLTDGHRETIHHLAQGYRWLAGYVQDCTLGLVESANTPDKPVSPETEQLLARMGGLAVELGENEIQVPATAGEDATARELFTTGVNGEVREKDLTLDKYRQTVSELTALHEPEEEKEATAFEKALGELDYALNPKESVLDRYQAFGKTRVGKILSKFTLAHAGFALIGVGSLQLAEEKSPGFGEGVRHVWGFGAAYSVVLTSLYYKIATGVIGVANHSLLHSALNKRDIKRDKVLEIPEYTSRHQRDTQVSNG